jgi:hypothetical protein
MSNSKPAITFDFGGVLNLSARQNGSSPEETAAPLTATWRRSFMLKTHNDAQPSGETGFLSSMSSPGLDRDT